MLRLFVGIDLPPQHKLQLSLMASGLPGAKWVDAGNYHVTLRFIGEVDEGEAADIDSALAQIRAPRFDVTLATVGHFGLRMLWVGIERNPALQHLHEKIESVLNRLGYAPEERRYTPHVTLARLKGTTEGKLQTYLSEHALFRAAAFPVERFSLIASYLTKSGAIYEDQADYALA
jgi:RNA 2',3'-cyclic 3'-phosphodiesterase